MSNYCFFTPDAQALCEKVHIKEKIELFSEQFKKQTYVIYRPLSKDDAPYDYTGAVVLFSSGCNPCFIDIDNNDEYFEDYISDFIDDVSYLSEKFKYRTKIGRKKHWEQIFKKISYKNLNLDSLKITTPPEKRMADLITSLVIGSINDVSKINLEASSLLEMVKSKIVLFDTDQTSFVFKSGSSKKFVIQGLAGSGKTELLLHKLKEIYSSNQGARIAFTCFNKILASSMRNRIPSFFDFMRVDKQIDWNKELFCFHAWGGSSSPYSGMYRYICHMYDISFGNLQSGSFDNLCKKAISDIKSKSIDVNTYIFDYVFIDESQDFADSFIELCELVTEKKVFVAGDVFQNIFRPIDSSVNRSDLVLKKCYRTDPRNLMFSHALGMGLYETPVLRWLKESEWQACGYDYKESDNRAIINRDPLRRFEDIPANFHPTSIHKVDQTKSISESIFSVIEQIKDRHETITQGDIAVLFLDKQKYIYNVIPELANMINSKLDWDVNVSFETKTSDDSRFFISNINNAKGLEFPFVICFALDLNRNRAFRNGLYTMMARSFLESHLILGRPSDSALLENLQKGLEHMNDEGYMDLRIPPKSEIENQEDLILWEEKSTLDDHVRHYCKERNASPRLIARLILRMNNIIDEDDWDETYVNQMLDLEYKRHEQL